ncbi:hypothetical protein K437DRAFT_130659 [Tilletiaria anomala UBC 951]|uniref:Myosin-binding domain-containing protein n=1 Tax=Tilletiaria anomala (strain ATCC 24038 / CBS 436.72 / UBC 951) TaxID=1037660 RepID=A0A066W1M3_TILAU|nr:uncharacterized protein K437DRAFT_130659 [Tilletiaria anomala UBC 951]KDN44695.1 hypothetical protein K437DRAFT_130659 [Tilletiaria anomala UBC 951]
MSSAPSGSTAGRASPSLFDGLPEHDDVTSIRYSALTSYSTTSQMGPSYEGAQSQMRLLPLRKMLARVMDEAEVGCVNISNQLDELVDKEEWELLKEMYSLDGALAVAGMDAKDSLLEGVSTSMDPAADLQSELDALSRPTSSASKAKRLSLLSSSSLLDAETAVSPQTMRSGYKRLSLLANGTKSIESPATSPAAGTSASKRSSVNLEDPLRTSSSIASCGRGTPSLDAQRRTGVGRLAYVHSDTPSNGTDTNYSKRLSYSSSTTSAASFGINNWAALGAGNASVALSQLAPFGDLSFSRDRASSPSMLGRVSPIPGTGGTSLSRVPSQRSGVVMQQPEKSANSIDPLSIAGLQMRHEHVHRTRRKMLVRLLALHFDADASYWRDARGLVASATDLFALLSKDVVKELRAEMGLDAAGKNATDSSLLKPPSQAKVGDLEGHPALEDRLNTMGILLRSIQLKLRACARDLHVKNPPELHGYDADTIVSLSSHQSGLSGTSSWQPTETMFESIKEDLLSLSAEWEGGLNIFNKELKCSASPKPPPAPSSSSPRHPVAGPREFESPQEADEDAWQEQDQGLTGVITMEDSSPLADHDLMDLVKQSTDPQYLPPPGLEQVFESIAGLVDFDPASAKVGLSRDERIARVREQRAKKLAEQQSQPKPADGAGKTVVISELKDVIAQIKQKRQLPASEDQEKKLGSPLEIDDPVIQQTGRFSSLACDVRSGSRSGSTSASTTPDLMQWPMQNAASFPQPSSRLRTPSSGSDSMGKSSRRQSQAINGLVSGVGSEVYGTWDPSDTTRSTLLESVSEGTESQSVEVTPTTAVHNLPRTKPSQTGVPSGIPVSTSSTSMKSASSAVSFGPANSHSLAQVMKLSHNARAGSRHVHRIGSGPSVVRRDSLDDAQPAQQPQLQPQSQELQSLTGQQAQRPVPVGSAF